MKLTIANLVLFFLGCHSVHIGFYSETCPLAESIIKSEVETLFSVDKGIAPGLLRMHFHDCFVRGCDGSILIDSTAENKAEKDGQQNVNSLRGFEVIDSAKAKLEAACKGVVSCSDILAYAVRDSAVLTGGLSWEVPAGRRDGRISRASETIDIPTPTFNLERITQSFAKKGLTQDEMVALLGAHTIGRSHCTSFASRLYNFSSTMSQDPDLNPLYAELLKHFCPLDSKGSVNEDAVVAMNLSPYLMDSSYYRNLFHPGGLFTSDCALLESQETAVKAAVYAAKGLVWQEAFVQAMIKMSQIEVLTGNQGEIRANCRVVNP